MSNLQDILKFTEFTQEFRRIERAIRLLKENRDENDAEHSFQLALVGWYIISSHKFKLDVSKVIKYALVHDLVEVYAGDTPLHQATQEMHDNKHTREQEAYERIKKEFPAFPEMHVLIKEYEERTTEESKFVYALDKLLPDLIMYLDEGHAWKFRGVTLNMVVEKKVEKMKVYPELKKYFDELIEIMRKDEKRYFDKI
jgi:putative hydrolase of HD superfamily